MHHSNIRFRWTDSWLLQSVAAVAIDGPAALLDMLEHADGVNKTPMAEAEAFSPEDPFILELLVKSFVMS